MIRQNIQVEYRRETGKEIGTNSLNAVAILHAMQYLHIQFHHLLLLVRASNFGDRIVYVRVLAPGTFHTIFLLPDLSQDFIQESVLLIGLNHGLPLHA